jgi:hypothetical protein
VCRSAGPVGSGGCEQFGFGEVDGEVVVVVAYLADDFLPDRLNGWWWTLS